MSSQRIPPIPSHHGEVARSRRGLNVFTHLPVANHIYTSKEAVSVCPKFMWGDTTGKRVGIEHACPFAGIVQIKF